MKCKNCGADIPSGASYCGICGTGTQQNSTQDKAVTYAKLVKPPYKSEPAQTGRMRIKSVKPVGGVSGNAFSDEAGFSQQKKFSSDNNASSDNEFSDFVEKFSAEKSSDADQTIEINIDDEQAVLIEEEFSNADLSAQESTSSVSATAPGEFSITPEQERLYRPMQILDWFIVWLLTIIPGVNIVMLFIWSFSKKTNRSKQSFARFELILLLVLIVIALLGYIISYYLGYDLTRYFR